MSFSSMGLSADLVTVLSELGYLVPTAVQVETIPVILAGYDVMARAQTGTGKTAAFALPIINQLSTQVSSEKGQINPLDTEIKPVRALILTPTRELALQVHHSFVKYGKLSSLNSAIVYGGVSIDAQSDILKAGVDILIATPGRLLDHLRRGSLTLKQLAFLVFDEADRMLDMGFKEEIDAILKQVSKQRQTLLFSATFDDAVFGLSKALLKEPKLIEVGKRNAAAGKVEQRVYAVDSQRKIELLCHLLLTKKWQQVLIFSRKKQGADKIALALINAGIKALAFHGDLSQGAREKVLQQFKLGEVQVLVATDVAARGLDVESLAVVVNYELPFIAEDYVHRIGRTGRAGNSGIAITLYSEEDALLLEEVEAVLDTRLPQQWLAGFEPDLTKSSPDLRKNSKSAQKQRARRRAAGGRSRQR
ncbi:DEAD/DEAH box helicase [Shewanella sp. D64]|uniref:DEAD/DEAH box helicase n=1 Tax=unclassified Shewanella TaxID=196818 RepID=UPI0022BA2744|nr:MULTISPECIES: DEAD/DEAH box helicase [unclassified Shewanella]MEC4726405.1 DEAD/DEAH box helicase [Shewanella sp. D64]MEC4738417.1 DEAD/DEAH box helicase [Shewanella sp. E94]WBJ94181.1 DEAD/DEAH box helicase [Shewanella sp. MTB7]